MSCSAANRAWGAALLAVLALALASCTRAGARSPAEPAASSAEANAAPPPGLARAVGPLAPAGVPTGMPGDDPAIQRWFLGIDRAKTAFDQALFQAERGIGTKTAADCQALKRTSTAIQAKLPTLRAVSSPAGAALAGVVDPMMTTMVSIADSCLSGNFVSAQTLLTQTGIPQQANVQARIDEILDGDNI